MSIVSKKEFFAKLFQQLESSRKVNNYSFCNEIIVGNFLNYLQINLDDGHRLNEEHKLFLSKLLLFLVQSFDLNCDLNFIWLIHSISFRLKLLIERYNILKEIGIGDLLWKKLKQITDTNYAHLYLAFSNKSLPSHLQFDDIIGFYRRLKKELIAEKDDCLQSILIKLRNSLYVNSLSASFVINVFANTFDKCQIIKPELTRLNVFNQIYLQALIHTLKNQNRPLLIDILIRCPDCMFADEDLLCQIIDYFCTSIPSSNFSTDNLLLLYSSCLFRSTPLLIKQISATRKANYKYRSSFIHLKSQYYFDLKECFLLAVYQKKHFINEFLSTYFTNSQLDISNLPIKGQIIIILLSLYNLVNTNKKDDNFFNERISRFESSLSELFVQYDSEDNGKDRIFTFMVDKLKFMFTFSNWCYENINFTKMDRYNFCYGIIASLLTGNSPLKILSNYGFFDFKFEKISFNEFKEKILCEYICELIAQYDDNEVMILKGFIVLRLIFFYIFSNENDNIYFDVDQIKSLIENIFPIDYRVEIMENMFSLLFLTKNDLNRDCNFNSSEDEDYMDETLSLSKHNSTKILKSKRKFESDCFNASGFICPNWIIPKLLEVLKDILYKTNSDLFSYTYGENKGNYFKLNFSGLENVDELKSRINILLKYVGDAQFRFDVIRPAFYKNISVLSAGESKIFVDECGSDCTSNELTRCVSNSSDTDHKNQNYLNTSLISCMLASHTQLLCYTLIENRLESSKQIVQLFPEELQNSKELKELFILDYFSELHSKICNVYSNYSVSTTHSLSDEMEAKLNVSELANIGMKASKIQSLIYEMLLKMENIDNETKKYFMLDYALASSPSLEIAQSILDSIFVQNNFLFFQRDKSKHESGNDKMEHFVMNIYKLIGDISHCVNINQLSTAEFLEKMLTFKSLLDSKAFVTNLQNEVNLKKSYLEFHNLLGQLEHRILDDPGVNQNSIKEDGKQLLFHFDKILTYCPSESFQYLKVLYSYVRKVSKALDECRKRNLNSHKNTIDSATICSSSHFSILKQSPSAILCSMVIKNKISPKIIDDLAQVMKVNLIGVLCSVYCPPIPSSSMLDNESFILTELCHPSLSELVTNYLNGIDQFRVKHNSNVVVDNYFNEDTFPRTDQMENSFQLLIHDDVLNYFHSKCSVLVELMRILELVNDFQLSNLPLSSSRNFTISSDSPLQRWVDLIKSNFFYGDMSSTLPLAFHPRIPSIHSAVIKTLEHYASNHNFVQLYNLFMFIEDTSINPEDSFLAESSNNSFKILQNAIYSRLAFIKEDAKYVFQIDRDPKMKADLTLSLLTMFDNYDETFFATRLLRLCLQSIRSDEVKFSIDATESKLKLEDTLREVEFYASVGQLTGLKTWKSTKENLQSIDILTIIKTKKRYSLAIDWHKINGFDSETYDLHMELLIYAYSELNDYASLRKLFNMFVDDFQSNNMVSIVEKTLNQVDNLDLRSFLADLLLIHHRKQNNYSKVEHYENYKVGIEILKLLSSKIQQDYLNLISSPLLLVEQLLMNGEIDSLEKIINQCKLIQPDELIEKYALKAVYIELYEPISFHGSGLLTTYLAE